MDNKQPHDNQLNQAALTLVERNPDIFRCGLSQEELTGYFIAMSQLPVSPISANYAIEDIRRALRPAVTQMAIEVAKGA